LRPEYFINVADKLNNSLQNCNKQAVFRTSIGRYYYGSFLLCRETLFEAIYPYREASFRSGKIHSIVKKVFLNSPNYYFIGDFLSELRDYRNRSDYNLLWIANENIVNKCKIYALEIKETLNNFKEENYTEIKNSFFELKRNNQI